MKRKSGTRQQSILARLSLPVMAVILVQSILYLVVFWQGGVVAHADENAYDILNERVLNRKQYIENEMIHKWTSFQDSEIEILDTIDGYLAQHGASYDDIGGDASLNEGIVAAVTDEIIYMLRRSMVTGAFIVLDGPGVQGNEQSRAALYIRDLDPVGYSVNDSDLLMERGMPSIAKARGIALDTYRSPAFEMAQGGSLEEALFHKPIDAARQYDNKQSSNYGYWSSGLTLSPEDAQVITYSIPLINSAGDVFGVMGIDITESYLHSLLQYQEITPERAGAYLLAITNDGGETFERVTSNGPLYQYALGETPSIASKQRISDSIYRFVGDASKTEVWGSVQYLNIYHTNTPFAGQKWALIGLVQEQNLLSFSRTITVLSNIATLACLILGVAGVFLASRIVTRPITALANDLSLSDPYRFPKLNKLNIKEIDELTASIESLTQSLIESSSKISKVLRMTKASIGVFEYAEGDSTVFCSSNLSKIMHLPAPLEQGEDFCLIALDEFKVELDAIYRNKCEGMEGTYLLELADRQQRYVQVTVMVDSGRVLGAVTDVTEDMLVKLKTEYERDYDVLTNLYNRRAFQEKAEECLRANANKCAALVMMDLDNLKYVNDTYGHDYGDRYIVSLAQSLQFFNVHGGIAACRSGDEFYTLLYGFSSEDELRGVIQEGWRLLQEKSFVLPNGFDYRMRVSGGIAWFPKDTADLDTLIQYADFAMYNSKHTMKGSLIEFNQETFADNKSVLYGQESLNNILDNVGLQFAFQPIIRVATADIFGYELLMRPQSERLKTPEDVLRIAHAQSKLHYVEYLTWFKGMEQFVKLNADGKIGKHEKVFINSVSSQTLNEEEIALFEAQFQEYLPRIVMEIMESDPDGNRHTQQKFNMIKNWGGLVALDDYGNGYNSEASLMFQTPNIVKLDLSVVRGVDHDPQRQQLIKDLISFVKSRSVEVLAEGVETKGEMEALISLGVEYLQGFYTGRPQSYVYPLDPEVTRSIRAAYQKKTSNK